MRNRYVCIIIKEKEISVKIRPANYLYIYLHHDTSQGHCLLFYVALLAHDSYFLYYDVVLKLCY